MRLSTVVLFLTFVVSASLTMAAPQSAPPKPGLPSESESPSTPPPDRTETIQWATPENSEEIPTFERQRVRREPRSDTDVQVHAGFSGGAILERESHQNAVVGAALSWADAPEKAWDFQADIGLSQWLRLGVGRRFYFSETQYLPYWKTTLTQTFEAGRLLSAAVDLERMKFGGAVGLADLFEDDRQWTVELGAAWGMIGFAFNVQAGWNFNW